MVDEKQKTHRETLVLIHRLDRLRDVLIAAENMGFVCHILNFSDDKINLRVVIEMEVT